MSKPGRVARTAEQDKRRKYGELNLVPVVFEVYGRAGDVAAALVRGLAAGRGDVRRSEDIAAMWRTLQTTLARVVVAQLATTSPLFGLV